MTYWSEIPIITGGARENSELKRMRRDELKMDWEENELKKAYQN